MKVTGTFTTPATSAQLRVLVNSPESLAQVAVLRDVRRTSDGVLSMVFTPRLAMGPVPLDTTVTTLSDHADGVELAVRGTRGTHAVDVALSVGLGARADGTTVSWTADVVVRGGVASVGQRVVGDLAARAIGDVLSAYADVAAGVPA